MLGKNLKKRKKSIGLSPGTLIYIGEEQTQPVKVSIIDYDEANLNTSEIPVDEIPDKISTQGDKLWLNIDGLNDINLLENLKHQFDIDPLVMEDILNTSHQPKIDIYEKYIFVIAKMITFDSEKRQPHFEHFCLIAGSGFVISFQEKEGDIFDPVRQRLKNANGRLRKQGTDYLLYALLDLIVDNYYLVLQQISDIIDSLDEEILDNPEKKIIYDIQHLKRTLLLLRRSIWPLRQSIHDLRNEDTDLISDFVHPYLNDLHDHANQVTETVEVFRDMVNSTMDTYLSVLSNKMNDVMRILTIIATIFIPLTFIAGIYGMNFENIPELKWSYGYAMIWAVIFLVAGSLIIFFRRRKWL